MKKKVDFISLKICREKTVEYESKGDVYKRQVQLTICNVRTVRNRG